MGAFDRLGERYLERQWRATRSLVENGVEVERGMWMRALGKLSVGLAAMMVVMWAPDPWDSAGWPLIGLFVGMYASASANRSVSYRSGWLDGRRDMVALMSSKGGHQGLTQAMEYDLVHVLGVAHPVIPDSPEGLDGTQ